MRFPKIRELRSSWALYVDGTIALTFAIGSALAAIAGVLLCSAYPSLTPYTGSMPGIKAFVAAVFGGIGSIPGAFIGGILLGIIEIFSKAYISSQMADAIVFAVLILVLLIKPSGLLGKNIQKRFREEHMEKKLKTNKKMKMSKTLKSNLITYGIVLAAYIIIQILISAGSLSSLIQGSAGTVVLVCHFGGILNLTVGVLGELSLGHAGFMCVGAFTSAFFSKCMQEAIPLSGVRFFIAILIGAASAGIFGILIGIPVLRLKGDYLAIVTLAFGEIIKNIINILYVGVDESGLHFSVTSSMDLNLSENGTIIIKGAQGITGTPGDSSFTVGVILLLITLFIVLNLVHSRDGRAIMAIRDNTIAAESVGINITKYKLMAFSISAALAGVAGVLYAHNISSLQATTKNFGYNMSIMILVFVVLGGIGNIRGSVISAVVLTLLPELLRGLNNYRMLIYAIVLIAMMLFNWAPKAIAWREKAAYKLRLKKTAKEAE